MAKIYLVEDDQAIRDVLEIFLTLENHVVRSFGSVQEFSERDLSETADLYLFDVMLPDGSGIDICNQIKSDHSQKHIPVIMMSAHADLTQMNDLCHPDSFVSKPFDIENLLLHIRNIILRENKAHL